MILDIKLPPGKKLYFLSDLHLGAPDYTNSLERELRIIRFLKSTEQDARAVFLVGDTFDFWFEYRHAVPKYYIRFFAQLIALKEKGIEVYVFTGNHDLWFGDYLKEEMGAVVFHDRVELQVKTTMETGGNTRIFLAHGDGLGPGDRKYKLLKKIFTNKVCQWLFRWLHPDIGIKIAQTWSRHQFTDPAVEVFHGEDREWLIQYSKMKLTEKHYDYFVMGHRHLPMNIRLNEKSVYINLGDWILNNNYAVFDGKEMQLIKFV